MKFNARRTRDPPHIKPLQAILVEESNNTLDPTLIYKQQQQLQYYCSKNGALTMIVAFKG